MEDKSTTFRWYSCTNNFICFGGINERYLFVKIDDELKCKIDWNNLFPVAVMVTKTHTLPDYQDIRVFTPGR